MQMKIKEIVILTRPNLDVSFHSPSSVYWYNTSIAESRAEQYFVEKYIITGKAEYPTNGPKLSADGLSLIHEIIYSDLSALKEVWTDNFLIGKDIDRNHKILHGITKQESHYFVETNQPIAIIIRNGNFYTMVLDDSTSPIVLHLNA